MSKNRKENKKIHAEAIKNKYFLNGKYLFIKHGPEYWVNYNISGKKTKPKVCISDKKEIGYSAGYNEISTPHTLDKYLKCVKEGTMILHDLSSGTDYECLNDYLREKMILKIAGVE